MREIKFRAWDKSNEEMINFDEIEGINFEGEFLYIGTSKNLECILGFEFAELMQYTGLKDKHGKEIYEGDLCKSYNGYIQEVVWKDNSWMYKMKVNKKYQGEAYVEIVYSSMGDTSHRNFGDEIIGNIYENPELLEG